MRFPRACPGPAGLPGVSVWVSLRAEVAHKLVVLGRSNDSSASCLTTSVTDDDAGDNDDKAQPIGEVIPLSQVTKLMGKTGEASRDSLPV